MQTSATALPRPDAPMFDAAGLVAAATRFREPTHLVASPDGRRGVSFGPAPDGWIGTLPPLFPEWLGDRAFQDAHGTRFAYVTGAMANGIATADLVIAMARAGMLGFFGAAGLGLHRIEAALDTIQGAVGGLPHGFNLIHAPSEPLLEAGTVDLYLKRGVRTVEAAAFMGLTAPLVRYAATGLRRLPDGSVHRQNAVFAKISRPETARRFLTPMPKEILDALVRDGQLSAEEAALARLVPVAEDVTVEADSGGHTDNQALGAMFPVISALRDSLVREHGYTRPIRVGAAGGLGTPRSVAAAYAMGAAFVVTGSVNQSAVEAGVSPRAKEMLCKAEVADVTMAPAADMFELGVEVQVLRRGTMFAARAHRLHDLYASHASLDEIPAAERQKLEAEILRAPVSAIWEETRRFWTGRDARQVERAERDPKHKMALVFRWYLGKASRWAIDGDADRVADYQVWCGPAQGAFNAWVKGSFLEPAGARTAVQIAKNLLEGAAVVTRAGQLRAAGVAMPQAAYEFVPRPLA